MEARHHIHDLWQGNGCWQRRGEWLVGWSCSALTFCTSTDIKFVTVPTVNLYSSAVRTTTVFRMTSVTSADRTRSCTRLARNPNWVLQHWSMDL